jgi:uncharacterized protein (TIGR03435 family)
MIAGVRAALVAGLVAAPVAAQQPAAPVYEVASVKANKDSAAVPRFQVAPGRYTWIANTVSSLISLSHQRNAFDRRETIGGPDWIDKDRFDVTVQAFAGAPLSDPDGFPGPVLAMVRAVLADRFGLVTHNEIRERPVYALTVSRADRRLGAGLKPTGVDCADALRKMVAPVPGPRAAGAPPCTFGGGPGRILGNNISLTMLANMLAGTVGRPVVDRTGVPDYFNVTLEYTPEAGITGHVPAGAPPLDPPVRSDAPSLFTAVQEQLGLKLESTRANVDVLVIDRVTQPTEN